MHDSTDSSLTAAGWQPIDTAPTTGPVVDVEVWNGCEVHRAHYAHGGGEEQPPFGPAWFSGVGDPISFYVEVSPPPTHWRSIKDDTHD